MRSDKSGSQPQALQEIDCCNALGFERGAMRQSEVGDRNLDGNRHYFETLHAGDDMTNNPTAQYYFAGLGFTMLGLDVRNSPNISFGSLTNQSFTQSLGDISFESATGTISFTVAASPEQVRDIVFTGNAITDSSGFVVGFSGTWKGERVIVVKAARAQSPRKQANLFVPPPISSLTVEGYWSAALANQIQ
jgi:hypothetical protein